MVDISPNHPDGQVVWPRISRAKYTRIKSIFGQKSAKKFLSLSVFFLYIRLLMNFRNIFLKHKCAKTNVNSIDLTISIWYLFWRNRNSLWFQVKKRFEFRITICAMVKNFLITSQKRMFVTNISLNKMIISCLFNL